MATVKKRKDSFLGIHSDFHATPAFGTVGATLREEDIREICRKLKPDFWEIDSKGHPGWASYPSKLKNSVPSIAFDTLEMWRRVTREEGVALYLHYSGLWDIRYGNEHPEECVVNADGSVRIGAIRPQSRYVDELMIPQLMEMAGDYGVDGVWIDGDCWMVYPDFHPKTVASFEAEYKISLNGKFPAEPTDPYYYEYTEFCRELYRRYVRHYTDTLHSAYPDFQICSNWAFTDHMPEKVCADVDFISGDLDPKNSLNSARYAGRALVRQGKPWDLMSWNFRFRVLEKINLAKHPIQVLQEAVATISLGGAYQDDVLQFSDGSPNVVELRELAGVYEFLRERKDYCFHGTLKKQVALLLSTHDRSLVKHPQGKLYSRKNNENAYGATALLCDAGQSVEIAFEHTLKDHFSEYPVIVVPETVNELKTDLILDLLEYAKNGGSLLLIGKKTNELFSAAGSPFTLEECPEIAGDDYVAFDVGYNFTTQPFKQPYFFTMDNKHFGGLVSPCMITSQNDREYALFGKDQRSTPYVLAASCKYGLGTVSAIGFDIGKQYLMARQYLHCDLIKTILGQMYEPVARIESSLGIVEIVSLEKDGKLMLQLLNANGGHCDPNMITENFIPPALDIRISVLAPKPPKRIVLQPQHKELPFEYRDGRAYFEISRLDIHNVVEVED